MRKQTATHPFLRYRRLGLAALALLFLCIPLFAAATEAEIAAPAPLASSPRVADEAQPPRLKTLPPKDTSIHLPADYIDTKSAHFLMSHPQAAQARANELLERAERRRVAYVRVLGVDPETPLRLILVRSRDDFTAMQPGGHYAPFWAAGLTYPSLGVIYLRQSGHAGQVIDVEKTLDHELSHALLHQVVGDHDIPRWFDEGLAQWQAREFDIERIVRLSGAFYTGHLIPLNHLDDHFPSHLSSVHLAYDQSYEFVSFLVAEYGEARLARLVAALAQGTRFDAALRASYGAGLAELEAAWHDDLRMSYAWLPLITSGTFVWLLASVLFLVGYVRKRRQKAKRLAAWDAEERLAWASHPFAIPPTGRAEPDEPEEAEFADLEESAPEDEERKPTLH